MELPLRLPNGNLLIPRRAESEGVIGDGAVEVEPGSAEYEQWLPFVTDDAPEP